MSKIIESSGLAVPSCLLQLGMLDRAAIKAFRVEEKAASRVLPPPDQQRDQTGIPKVCYSVSARKIPAIRKLLENSPFSFVACFFRVCGVKLERRVETLVRISHYMSTLVLFNRCEDYGKLGVNEACVGLSIIRSTAAKER